MLNVTNQPYTINGAMPLKDGSAAADAAPVQQVANKANDANTVDVEAKTKS